MATAIEYSLIAALIAIGVLTQAQAQDEAFLRDFLATYEGLCVLEGTNVSTPSGPRPVETLKIGDPVVTADGTVRPVRWIGRQTIVAPFADPLRSWPIRLAPGALADRLPVRPLYLSPDHALLVDGLLVQAGALVNGTTIVRVTDVPERFLYVHVELADHALILAEGVAVETFVDNVARRRFDNYAEYAALYGEAGPTIAEIAAPRVKSARQVPAAVRRTLAQRAAILDAVTTSAAA